MHAFDVLGDPVRRRDPELLATGELPSGAITAVVQAEFGFAAGSVTAPQGPPRERLRDGRPDGARRLYAVELVPFRELDDWLEHFRWFWDQRLDLLTTELARGKLERRLRTTTQSAHPPKETTRYRYRP